MELNELRNQIDQIDEEMAVLFEKRMKIVKQIGEYKKENNLPILDKKREEEVIEKNSKYLHDEHLIPLYKEFLITLMNLSKRNEE